MGNVSVKSKRMSRHSRMRKHFKSRRHSRRRGGMHSPQREEASPRSVIRRKMRDSVTRRKIEAKANSENPFGNKTPASTRRRGKKSPPKDIIYEEKEE